MIVFALNGLSGRCSPRPGSARVNSANWVPSECKAVLSAVALCLGNWISSISVCQAEAPVWLTNWDEALDASQTTGKPLIIKVGAEWCAPCRQMKELTWNHQHLLNELSGEAVLLQVDVDQQPNLVSQLSVTKYPTTIVRNSRSQEVYRLVGVKGARDLLSDLRPLLAAHTDSGVSTDVDVAHESNVAILPAESELEPPVSAVVPENRLPAEFDGICLVALLEENRVVSGEFSVNLVYHGKLLQFASAEHRQKFVANPTRYWPVAGGFCPVAAVESDETRLGNPRAAVVYLGRLWFFSNENSQRQFLESPQRFLSFSIRQAS